MTPLVKRLSLFLALSVALNLLFVGFAISRWTHRGPHARGEFSRAFGGPPGWRHPHLRSELDKRWSDVRLRRDSTRQARHAVRDALEAEPFDGVRLEQSLTALRAETLKSQELFQRALLEAAQRSTPEARKDLARSFAREGKFGR